VLHISIYKLDILNCPFQAKREILETIHVQISLMKECSTQCCRISPQVLSQQTRPGSIAILRQHLLAPSTEYCKQYQHKPALRPSPEPLQPSSRAQPPPAGTPVAAPRSPWPRMLACNLLVSTPCVHSLSNVPRR
jgi:hypothetical protein